jgi:hypothetical protein
MPLTGGAFALRVALAKSSAAKLTQLSLAQRITAIHKKETTLMDAKVIEELRPRPETIIITQPNFVTATIGVESTAPFVFNKFSARSQAVMVEKQEAGQQAKNRRKRDPKDFEKIWRETVHYAEGAGWHGFPAASIRNALIEACKTVGFKMTIAKLSVFVEADGYDATDGQPLIKMLGEEPSRFDCPVRLSMGSTDIATRGRIKNWSANLRVRWDADQFSATDIMNLMARAGEQVGIGAGRPSSRTSTGMGWGTFRLS